VKYKNPKVTTAVLRRALARAVELGISASHALDENDFDEEGPAFRAELYRLKHLVTARTYREKIP